MHGNQDVLWGDLHGGMMDAREQRRVQARLKEGLSEVRRWMSQPRLAINKIRPLREELRTLQEAAEDDQVPCLRLLLEFAGLQIDAAAEAHDSAEIKQGREWAEEVFDSPLSDGRMQAVAAYYVANAITEEHLLTWAQDQKNPETKRSRRAPLRLTERENLRRSRALWASASQSTHISGPDRSSILCNLGNALDESGRWVEAYQCYADSLQADPNNGNAAGNALELLRRRIAVGNGLLGHYAAVHDFYLEKAKALRHHTVAIAGEATARRWDAVEPLRGQGHLSHDGDSLNDYQQWIKDHRVALTLAVEGFGSDEPRWDTAALGGVAVRPGEPDPPPIFTSMNVLKAEFLAVRRLAFHGETMLLDSLDTQHPEDTGWYADTLDNSYYGEPSAMLVLAQRASLDVLDKIAVAANEHFKTGLDAGNISFRNYWFDNGTGMIRKGLPLPSKGRGAAIALAELSHDLHPDGLYPSAQTLRNAATHRLVHLTHGETTGITADTHSTVNYLELIHAVHESLRVARSAYIYLIDLVDEQEANSDSAQWPQLPLPMQE